MNQETVLIVEDDPLIRDFLRERVARTLGYRVLEAGDGQRGLALATTQAPDVILLDLGLPDLSGLDMLRRMRRHNIDIPSIILTAHGSADNILTAFRLGAREFLQKPIGVDEVPSAIEKVLNEARLRREKEQLTEALREANLRLQQQVRNWRAINNIAQALTSTLEEKVIFRRVLENVNRILQVEVSSLVLVDRETGGLHVSTTLYGDGRANKPRLSDVELDMGEGIAGWVAAHKQPLIVPDVDHDPRFYAEMERWLDVRIRSVLCVPLLAKSRVIGVLEVSNKLVGPDRPRFTQEDLELLTTLGSWVVVAIENARLNRITQRTAATTTLQQAVTAMAHHINNRTMTFSLILDDLENVPVSGNRFGVISSGEKAALIARSARNFIRDISDIVKAMDEVREVRTVHYAENLDMLDLAEALNVER
jgi:DNA-binding response OmpR family regulator